VKSFILIGVVPIFGLTRALASLLDWVVIDLTQHLESGLGLLISQLKDQLEVEESQDPYCRCQYSFSNKLFEGPYPKNDQTQFRRRVFIEIDSMTQL